MLTLEEAKENHRKMWDYISNQNNNDGIGNRNELKASFISNNDGNSFVVNHCYLCQYAAEQAKTKGYNEMCKYCPALWGSENFLKNGYCECSYFEDEFDQDTMIDWIDSDPEKVRDVPFKDEVGKGEN